MRCTFETRHALELPMKIFTISSSYATHHAVNGQLQLLPTSPQDEPRSSYTVDGVLNSMSGRVNTINVTLPSRAERLRATKRYTRPANATTRSQAARQQATDNPR